MRRTMLISAAVLCLAAAPAVAQSTNNAVPPGDNPLTGARPGNIPGTNNSLPLGNTASNIDSGDTLSAIAPRLPTPSVGENASISQYLGAAQQALRGHHTGEAQQALEMAETRALDRSTLPADASVPDSSPLVTTIQQALNRLGQRDWSGANQAISQAMGALTPTGTKTM